MDGIRVVRDLEEARFLWEAMVPADVVTGLWEVRACFHRSFRRPLHFLVQEQGGRAIGLLPLSWVEEEGAFAFFPGETWRGRTWLEQNVIPGDDPQRLLRAVPGPYHIRYLLQAEGKVPGNGFAVDETGYLFRPPAFGYDISAYLELFSGKSLKRIRREIAGIRDLGIRWRHDRFEDVEHLISLNLFRFGGYSYFGDPRFKNGFREMLAFFADHGWLRVTTALIAGQVAAVDAGVLYEGVYTLLAGGTSPAFPGIAKVINMYHMERACEEKIEEVDFLCGDFNWKKMFHLQERPLFVAAESSVRAA